MFFSTSCLSMILPTVCLPGPIFPSSAYTRFFGSPYGCIFPAIISAWRVKGQEKKRKQKVTSILSTLFGGATGAPFSSFSGHRGRLSFEVLNGCTVPLPVVPPLLEYSLMTGACLQSHQKNQNTKQKENGAFLSSLLYAGALLSSSLTTNRGRGGFLLQLFPSGSIVGIKNKEFPRVQAGR